MKRITRTLLLSAALFLFAFPVTRAQTVEILPPDDLTTCGQATWQVRIFNTSGTALTGLELSLHFTTTTGAECGIAYVPGTVSGATEADPGNPAMPVFALADLAAGDSVLLTLDAAAGCGLYDCINSGELFVTQATLTFDGGTTTATTPPFNAFTPLLVITQVDPTVGFALAGDTLMRTIAIRNTREGSLAEFVFVDEHPAFFPNPPAWVGSDQGEVLVQGTNVLELRFDADDFAQVGNGDGLFDKDEVILITEKIALTDCNITGAADVVSQISVRWGCDGLFCQESEATAVVQFAPRPEPSSFAVEWDADSLICLCEPAAAQVRLTNTTGQTVEQLVVALSSVYWSYRMDTTSLVALADGVPVAWVANWELLPTDNCLSPPQFAASGATLTFPDLVLAPGSTLELAWFTGGCTNGCTPPPPTWNVAWQYDGPCIDNQLDGTYFTQPTITDPFATTLALVDTTLWLDSAFVAHLYFPTLQPLADTGAALQIVLAIQPPLAWADTNTWALSGVLPDSLRWLDPDSTRLLLSYPWPLPTDTAHLFWGLTYDCVSFCADPVPISQCDLIQCDSSQIPNFPFTIAKITSSVLLPLDDCARACRPQSCDTIHVANVCMAGLTYDTIRVGTFVDYTFSTQRTTLGLRDDDNDRIADSGAPADPLLAALDRALPGDTLLSRIEGLVVVDTPGYLPDALEVGIEIKEAGGPISLPSIQPLDNVLTIFDASTGQAYVLENLPLQALPTNTSIRYHGMFSVAELALMGYDIPPDFVFDADDEIDFSMGWALGDIQGSLALVTLSFTPVLKVYEASGWEGTNCGCHRATVAVANPRVTFLPGVFPLPPCDTSDFAGGTLLKVELPEPNFFPFEVRPLASFASLAMTLPDEVSLAEGKVTLYQLQGGTVLAAHLPLPVVPGAGTQYFDMSGLLPQVLPDEGWVALMQYRFLSDCTQNTPLPLAQTATIEWQAPLLQAGPEQLDNTSNALRPLRPNLMLTGDPLSAPYTAQAGLVYTLVNKPAMVGSVSSGTAPNVFLYLENDVFSDCQMWRLPDSIPIPEVNGIFQIGDIAPDDTVRILLQCGYEVCQTTTTLLSWGWNCSPYESTVETPCALKQASLILDPLPGEIEMTIPQPPDALPLCAESGPFELTFYNAEKGRLYDPVLRLYLPEGFTYTPGSAQIQWPCPDPDSTWLSLADPEVVGANILEWGPDKWPAQLISEGIGGILEEPYNRVCFRFNGLVNCDLASPDYFIATITSRQGCGAPSNLVARVSDTIRIEGAGAPLWSATINADLAVQPDACGDLLDLTVSITPDSDLPAGQMLTLTLPAGLTFLPGSCTPISVITDCTPTVQGNVLTWTLPAISQGEVAAMAFQVVGLSQLDCQQHFLRWRLLSDGGALFCASTGDTCQVALTAGSLIQPLQLERPAYRIAGFGGTVIPAGPNDHLAWTATVFNDGGTITGTFTGSLYLDNGNGQLDAADQLIQQVSASIPPAGTSITLSGNAVLPANQWCNLLLVVPDAGECACKGDVATFTLPVEVIMPDTVFACPGQPTAIGIADPGALGWQWEPATGIACPTCPSTTIALPNDLPTPQTYTYTLHGQLAENCFVSYRFAVVVQPPGGIASAAGDLCEGQPLVLIASDGLGYTWSGPGLSDTTQVVIVETPQSGTYYLSVTDANGCVFTDSVAVQVRPRPTADAGGDYVFCPEDEAVLQAAQGAGYTYQWTPGLPWLDAPQDPAPHILIREDQTYVLEVTNSYGCIDRDTVQVSFGESPDLMPPADVTLCDSGLVTLSAGGAAWYEWAPPGDCLDAPCSQVQYFLSENTTLVLTGYSEDGCTASALVELTLADDTIFTMADTLWLCEGESVQLFPDDPPVSMPGIYCHTFLAAGGCDSIACVPVAIVPPPDTGWVVVPPPCEGTPVDFFGQTLDQAGTYCATLTSAAGCDSLVCTELSFLPGPELEVAPAEALIEPGGSVQLELSTTADSILWSPPEGLSCTDCTAPTAMPDSSTQYTVTVVDDNGCTRTAQVRVIVAAICQADSVLIPNFFTPNGDGVNDTFGPLPTKNQSGALYSLEIWNRWGQRVFMRRGTDVQWDGTWLGNQLPADVYFYMLEVQCPDGQANYKGEVTLMR